MLTEEGPSKAMTMKGVPVPASAFINDATATMSSVRPQLLRQKGVHLPRCGRRTSPQRRGGGEGDPPLQVGQLSLMQCRPVLAVVEGDWDPFPICVTRGSSCQDSFCRINVLSGRRRMRSSTGWSALLMDQN